VLQRTSRIEGRKVRFPSGRRASAPYKEALSFKTETILEKYHFIELVGSDGALKRTLRKTTTLYK
jgi:hypothetical protein